MEGITETQWIQTCSTQKQLLCLNLTLGAHLNPTGSDITGFTTSNKSRQTGMGKLCCFNRQAQPWQQMKAEAIPHSHNEFHQHRHSQPNVSHSSLGSGSHVPMVQMMPVFLAVVGSESMSRRHMCSRKVSAMAACSCWVWMKAVPASWCLDMVTGVRCLQQKKMVLGLGIAPAHLPCRDTNTPT